MPVFENDKGRQLGAPSGSRLEAQLVKERWTPVDDAPAPKKTPAAESAPPRRGPGRPKKEEASDE